MDKRVKTEKLIIYKNTVIIFEKSAKRPKKRNICNICNIYMLQILSRNHLIIRALLLSVTFVASCRIKNKKMKNKKIKFFTDVTCYMLHFYNNVLSINKISL